MKVLRNKLETVPKDVELDTLENIFKKTGTEWPEDDPRRQKFKGRSAKAKSKPIRKGNIRFKTAIDRDGMKRGRFSAD